MQRKLANPHTSHTSFAVLGQSTLSSGRPSRSRAAASTGVGTGVLLLPRPRGLPGWLTTAEICTWCPFETKNKTKRRIRCLYFGGMEGAWRRN